MIGIECGRAAGRTDRSGTPVQSRSAECPVDEDGHCRGGGQMEGLPRELQPRWRAVPGLVWTMARADAPAPGLLGAVQAVATGVFLTAPVVVGARAVGELASRDRRALLVVRLDDSPRRRLVRLVTAAAAVAVPWGLVLVAFWIAIMHTADFVLPAEESVRLATAAGLAFVAKLAAGACVLAVVGAVYLALFVVVISPRWAVFRETREGARQERVARAEYGVARGTSIYLEAYAAWPQQRGHGRDLAKRVRPVAEAAAASTGRPIMAVARNTKLVEVYQEFGLAPVVPDSLVLVNMPRP